MAFVGSGIKAEEGGVVGALACAAGDVLAWMVVRSRARFIKARTLSDTTVGRRDIELPVA